MWCNRLSKYLINYGYNNYIIYPSVFAKKSESEFTIFTTYVVDMNLIGAPRELLKTPEFL